MAKTKIKLQIKNRWTGEILFEFEKEGNTHKETVTEFLKEKAGTTIRDADLSEMDLSGVSFYNSSFYNSSFDNSSFYNSSFYNSSFDNSSFDNSSFDNSSFYNSSFYNSSFYNSSFYNSSFDNSTIKFLEEANQIGLLDFIRDDYWAILIAAGHEVPGIRAAIIEGRIDGSAYEGTCACLCGTIANIRGVNYKALEAIKPNSNRPVERFFANIKKGDTPETNISSKYALQWLDEFVLKVELTAVSWGFSKK
jgi:uncharacterized protein YjbI with pentapeptide repeats